MPQTPDPDSLHARLRQLEEMLQKVEQFKDPAAQACTRMIVQSVLELHGHALFRMLEHLNAAGAVGQSLIDQCATDELISGVLLLHNLHPLSLEARILQALDSVRPYLSSHGGNVELLDATDGVIRLRLQGSCHGCPSSAVTLKQTIETAIWEKAPDATAIEVEAIEPESDVVIDASPGRFSLPILAG